MKQPHPAHVLLVEDELALVQVMEPVLTTAGHRVTVVTTGEAAIGIASSSDIDLILLDLGLPDLDGKKVIAAIRKFSQIPIIVISARDQESERIAALDAGSDDYVRKPFDVGELLARIRAIIRRLSATARETRYFKTAKIEIDFETRTVKRFDQEIRLSPKEFDLLKVLALNAGKIVTRARLMGAGWSEVLPDPQYLRTYIGHLRQKLERNPSTPDLIISEPGVGYRLDAFD